MKTSHLAALLLLCLTGSLFATKYEEKSLPELVSLSQYILAGDVVDVRMTDKNGKEVTDPAARTGPGQENTIYLDVVVDHSLILKSPSAKIPREISIPLDQMRQISLGESKTSFLGKSFFLLDKEFHPVYPAGFQRSLDEQPKLQSIIRRLHSK